MDVWYLVWGPGNAERWSQSETVWIGGRWESFFFSFLVPVCPDLATFKEGRVHHRGKASFRLIFKRECFNASVNQTNVKWPIFLLVFPASNQLLKEINVLEIQFQIERSCRESAEALAVKVCCVLFCSVPFCYFSFPFLTLPYLSFLSFPFLSFPFLSFPFLI